MVRGTVVLPHGTGKVVRVAVFAQGEKAQEALRAGADEVGSEDLVKKIEAGWLEFDVALAAPDMMGMVGRLGQILGRRGLMPNPKSGTITFDLDRAIREVKSGRVEFKVDKGAIIHVPVGKASFEAEPAGREPGQPRRRHQPRQAGRRQGPVPADADHRHHHGPRHPRRHPGRPRAAAAGLDRCGTSSGRRSAANARSAGAGGATANDEDGSPQTACARGRATGRKAAASPGA